MLHIVNGDSVADKLRQGIVQGDILVWREVYPHGPVFADPAAGDHRLVRAQYLEHTLGIPHSEYVKISEMQEKTLADFQDYEEIVLWFEHDLFDQTMLCCLLDWFSRRALQKTKLRLLCIGEFPGVDLFRGLGQLSLEQMKTLPGAWKSIGAQELDLGKAFWQAYTAPDPGLLQQLLSEDTSILPFAHDAFELHLSRFPSTHNGLGIVEQKTLEMLAAGVNTPYRLFEQVGNKLHTLGMGDLQYWHILMKMAQEPYPLVQIQGEKIGSADKEASISFLSGQAAMTDLGKNVMDGIEDWVAMKGIDEWYGGVHLYGHSPRWRWDSSQQRIQAESR